MLSAFFLVITGDYKKRIDIIGCGTNKGMLLGSDRFKLEAEVLTQRSMDPQKEAVPLVAEKPGQLQNIKLILTRY
ncbi:MAG: hypothetical protein ACJA13_000276 [Paraglaciecola sp.]